MNYRVRFDEREITASGRASLLESLLAAGVAIPNGCRSGVCQSCLLRVTAGEIPRNAQAGLSVAQRETGLALACQLLPESDLSVSRTDAGVRYACRTIDVFPLSETVFRLRLERPDGFAYRAGQYVTLWRDEHHCRAYSLASLPDEDFLEFHVRRYDGGCVSPWLCALQAGDVVELRGPMGSCVYAGENPDTPLLLAGNGVGLAPLWGIARSALAAGHRGRVQILHGVTEISRAYLDAGLRELAASHPRLEYEIVVGGTADLAVAMLAKASGFFGWQAFLCGAPETVDTLRKHLFLAGAASRDIHADAFVAQAG